MDGIKVHVCKYPDRANLMMRFRDPDSGKQIARSTGTTSEAKALKVAAVWEDELRQGRYQKPQRLTWAAFREQLTTDLLDGMKVGTAATYDATLNTFEELTPVDKLAALTTQRITAFVTALRNAGRKPATIARHLRGMKRVARWAHQQGLLLKLPQFNMPKHSKGAKHRTPTLEEIERMIEAAPKVMGAKAGPGWQFYLKGLNTSGLRLAESLVLSWDDAPGAIVVDRSGRRPMLRIDASAEKAGKHRLLPMTPEFWELLSTVPPAERKGWVFKLRAKTGDPVARTRFVVGPHVTAIGAKAGCIVAQREKVNDEGETVTVNAYAGAHDFRRAFGFRWSRRVVPSVLRELMRHASVATTEAYYIEQNAEATADALWAAAGNSVGNSAGFTMLPASPENSVSR